MGVKKRKLPTRRLTARVDLFLCPEKGNGMITLFKGEKVPVTFSPGSGWGLACESVRGTMYTAAIDGNKGPEMFTNWPKEWKGY